MHIRMIGDGHDGIGFGLAGVESIACRTGPELAAAVDEAEHDPDVGIIMLSPSAAALDPDLVGRLRAACHMPITIVLP